MAVSTVLERDPMRVEKIREIDEEIELSVRASEPEIEHAFTVGLDCFVDERGLSGNPGNTAREKICYGLDPDQARDTISSAVVGFLIPFALDKADIIPMNAPQANCQADPVQGEAFEFTVTVMPKPEFELTDYSPVEVAVPAMTEVTEADIDQQVAMLAHQFATVRIDEEGEEVYDIPEVTDEWVKNSLYMMDVNTVEELRESFREQSRQAKLDQFEQTKMAACLEAYSERFEGEISDKLIKCMADDLFAAFSQQLAAQGTNMIEFCLQNRTDEKAVRASLANQSEMQLRQGFILDALFRHEGMKLEIADLKTAIHNMAPGNEEEVFEKLHSTGRTFMLKETASRTKALMWMLQNSKIKVL